MRFLLIICVFVFSADFFDEASAENIAFVRVRGRRNRVQCSRVNSTLGTRLFLPSLYLSLNSLFLFCAQTFIKKLVLLFPLAKKQTVKRVALFFCLGVIEKVANKDGLEGKRSLLLSICQRIAQQKAWLLI